jgi:hypothetical protein
MLLDPWDKKDEQVGKRKEKCSKRSFKRKEM